MLSILCHFSATPQGSAFGAGDSRDTLPTGEPSIALYNYEAAREGGYLVLTTHAGGGVTFMMVFGKSYSLRL